MHAILNIVFRSEGKQNWECKTYIHHHFSGAFNFARSFVFLRLYSLCTFIQLSEIGFKLGFWIQKLNKTTKRNAYVHFSYNLMKKTKHLFLIFLHWLQREVNWRKKKKFQWKVCIVRHSSLPFKFSTFGSAFFCLLFFT